MPNESVRLEIFKIHTAGKPINDDVDLSQLAQMTEGCVGADIEFICKRASMLAIRGFIQIKGEKDFTKIKIYPGHFQVAMEQNNKRQKSVESRS